MNGRDVIWMRAAQRGADSGGGRFAWQCSTHIVRLLCFLLLASCVLPVAAVEIATSRPAPAASWQIRLATFNVCFGNDDLKLAVEAIRQSKADFVFLQETTAVSEKLFRSKLGREYPHMFFRGYRGRFPAERLGFLSRYPLEKPRFVPPRFGLFGTLVTAVVIDGRRVQLVNVHLKPLRADPEGGMTQLWRALAELEAAHGREAKAILDGLEKSVPAIVAGDFNSVSGSTAPRLLQDAGFVDSHALTKKDGREAPTWQWELSSGPLELRIDYVFASPEFKPLPGKIIEQTGSDHFLVSSTLGWVGRRGPAMTQPAGATGSAPASQPAKIR